MYLYIRTIEGKRYLEKKTQYMHMTYCSLRLHYRYCNTNYSANFGGKSTCTCMYKKRLVLLNMANVFKLEWCCNYMNYHTVQIWQRFSYTHILYMKTNTVHVLHLLTLSMCEGRAPLIKRYCTTLICPPALARESTVWSLLDVWRLTSAPFETRNCTVWR